jgi:autotransporter-associated beta strand protein
MFSSDGFRIGHWGGAVSTYNLSAGTLLVGAGNTAPGSAPAGGGEQGGGIYVGVDGVGVLNQTGGTITTPWVVLDNRGSTAAINGQVSTYNLSGGTLVFNSGTGLISNNLLTGLFNWTGGTIRNTATGANAAIATNVTVTGTSNTLDTVANTNGFTFKNDVLGGGTINTTGGGTLFFSTTGLQTVDAIFTGTSGVTKQGSGSVTIKGAQAYTGATLVSAGTFNLAGNIPGSDLTVSAGANLQGLGTAKSITFGNNTSFSADPTAATLLTATNALTINGTDKVQVNLLAGPAGTTPFTILNYGSTNATGANFILTGAASYRNAPTFNVGTTSTTLQLGFGQLTWSNSAGLFVWDNNTTANFTNNATLVADKFIYGDVVTFDDSLGVSQGITLAGNIQPTGTTFNNSSIDYIVTTTPGNALGGYGRVLKTGTGMLTLAGTAANTYSAGTVLSQGRINVQHQGSLSTGTVTIGDVNTGANNLSIFIDGARPTAYLTAPMLVTANGTGTVTLGSSANVTGTGVMGFSGITLARDVLLDANAADRTDFNAISGTGNVTFIGTGRTILGLGLPNTFTGNVTLAGTGNVQVGAATGGTLNGIPDNATLIINATSRFVMSAGAEIIGGLSGAGAITTNQYAGTLTVGTGNATSTFSGVIGDTAGYALSLNKVGTGTLTLSGANTFLGTVTIGTSVAAGGTVEFANTNTFSGLTVWAGNAKVSGALNNTGNITLNNGATL